MVPKQALLLQAATSLLGCPAAVGDLGGGVSAFGVLERFVVAGGRIRGLVYSSGNLVRVVPAAGSLGGWLSDLRDLRREMAFRYINRPCSRV